MENNTVGIVAIATALGAVGGALIGAFGSIATTWLNAHLNKVPPDPYDENATKLLKAMLEQGPRWRTLITLSNVIGADLEVTKEYLLALGARGSQTNPGLWGLVARNPLPNNDQEEEK
ncbi:MAG: hypothetical protein J0H78_20150 [Rhizobiales bacterium]|nr:hypothetical protein [Hyphomicrobiales bacterium]